MSHLFVMVGPTAVGKGTLVRALRDRHPELWVSVSATTREPRPGEVDGVDYVFVSDAAFDAMIRDGELLEWATVHGDHRYGTPRGPIDERRRAGLPSVLEIDLQGARQVKRSMPDAVGVFIAPPSWDALVSRLEGRATEDAAQRERRLATAKTELAAIAEFDHVVVNDDIDQAVSELEDVMGLSR